MGRVFLTVEQAISCLNDGEYIHTFANPGGTLLGCDISRESLIDHFNEAPDKIEIGGEMARSMKHGLVVMLSNGPMFVEANEEKLKEYENAGIKD